ncbi:hypothetical protein F4781DRAFT_253745 [Annulohypoxylon bovei var. microspora]|nr:hypothetical protein F4781DRAFT_253745 [Annulohypoxylon bovei var. microspora]
MYLPANTAAIAAAGINLPPDSIVSNYPNSNSNADSHYYYSNSNSNFLQQPQPRQYQQQHSQQWNLDVGGGMRKMRKRKAESQDNERLSKRLSLLNLEKNGQKLYVPVESPQLRPTECTALAQIPEDDSMQLDDSKHKVYIYNLDDELSESESDGEGRLVFLPDIEKHLMQNRIPPSVLANKDGEIAGMQMVLYSEPSSLTVPKEQDSVRKAIIEARQRVREKQKEEREQEIASATSSSTSNRPASSTFDSVNMLNGNLDGLVNGFANHGGMETSYSNDPDAMEVD